MKLYLLIDYFKSHYDDCVDDCEDTYNYANPAASTQSGLNEHEHYQDYKSFVMRCLGGGAICRNSYETYEYPLIEVPDELVFQFMMLGLKDYDYIAYNHRNKQICVGNNPWEVTSECSRDKPKPQNQKSYGVKGSNPTRQSNSKNMFAFPGYSDDCEDTDCDEDSESFVKVISTADGYQDFIEVIKPFVHNHFVKETRLFIMYLRQNDIRFGRSTDDCSNEGYAPALAQSEQDFIQESLVPRDSIMNMFLCYLNDDELITNNTKVLQQCGAIETLRRYTVDILAKYHEN